MRDHTTMFINTISPLTKFVIRYSVVQMTTFGQYKHRAMSANIVQEEADHQGIYSQELSLRLKGMMIYLSFHVSVFPMFFGPGNGIGRVKDANFRN